MRSSSPLMKAAESSVPKLLASSMASLMVTLRGMSARCLSSKTPRRSTLRSMRYMRSMRQLWLCFFDHGVELGAAGRERRRRARWRTRAPSSLGPSSSLRPPTPPRARHGALGLVVLIELVERLQRALTARATASHGYFAPMRA